MDANNSLLKRRAANMRVTRVVAYPTLLTPNKLREMLERIPSHADIIDISVSGIQHPHATRRVDIYYNTEQLDRHEI